MIARDKKLHFLVGIAIAIVVGLALMWLPTRLNEAPAGFFGVLAAGGARPPRHDRITWSST
jgi:hypothetical protein